MEALRLNDTEGPCEMPWFPSLGSLRHYCENASVAEIVIDGEKRPICSWCIAELFTLDKIPPEILAELPPQVARLGYIHRQPLEPLLGDGPAGVRLA